MIKKIVLLFTLLTISSTVSVMAEEGIGSLISPGELASPHAKYDSIKGCTECHSLGGGIPDSKCLDCHKKLAEKISSKKGSHAGYTGACIKCHADHKGRGYKMIVLEKNSFNHDVTGYVLKDKHNVDCIKCHKTEGKFSGLSRECTTCHKDPHKGQLGSDCERCHYIKDWKDVERFDHDRDSKYPLTGKHVEVKCVKCHENNRFKIEKSEECITCHKDPHKGKPLCKDCHTTESWKKVKIDHDKTRYPLKDRHNDVACGKCHKNNQLKGIPFATCESSACHSDPHKQQFKDKKCEACHNIKGWKPSLFGHDSAEYKGYKLEGKHVETKCEKCHAQGRFKPLNYKTCETSDCHTDIHKGQFKGKNCESCHTVKGWKPSLFGHDSAEYKGYKLEGRHVETKCEKCHAQGRFKPLNYKTCETADCHRDVHKGQFAGKGCESCHTVKGWKPSLFKHEAPEYKGYKLDGKHVNAKCEKCHVDGRYKPLSSSCSGCHGKDDVHKGELGGNCQKCHDTRDWKKFTLNHNTQTKFPLIGKHVDTKCEKCHKERRYKSKAQKCKDCHEDIHKGKFKEDCTSCHTQSDWLPRKFDHKKEGGLELRGVHVDLLCITCHVIKGEYKKVYRFCNQCHNDPHFNQFGSLNCSDCHSESSWIPTRFDHSRTGFPLVGSHRLAECEDCHKNRVYRITSAQCISCHTPPASHVSLGYSHDCRSCHRAPLFSSWAFSHPTVSGGCSSCHLSERPSSHTSNPTKYPTTCESCHNSTTTWTSHVHPSLSSGCSSCHLSERPSSHTSDPTKYPTTCESCHNSTVTWTSHVHPTAGSGCSTCHLPQMPSSHSTNGYGTTCENCHKSTTSWTFSHSALTASCYTCHSGDSPATHSTYSNRFGTSCENCHQYPSWLPATFNHSFTPFPIPHRGYGQCSDCHPSQNYGNKGGCIECHTSTGARVHESGTNAGCLSCHANGRVPKPRPKAAPNAGPRPILRRK